MWRKFEKGKKKKITPFPSKKKIIIEEAVKKIFHNMLKIKIKMKKKKRRKSVLTLFIFWNNRILGFFFSLLNLFFS